MRMFEECPYITPCGFCSRQGKPCDYNRKKPTIPTIPPFAPGGKINIPEEMHFGKKEGEE